MQFEFSTPQRIIFGPGTIEQLKTLANPCGKKAMVVTGTGGAKPEKLFNILQESGITTERVIVSGEPTTDLIRQAVETARATGCEFIIGFGGGSVLDSGKAIAAMLTNPGDLMDYLEIVGKGQPLLNQAAPYIAIPTTSGTGSEVTKNAVLLVPDKKLKVSLRSLLMYPSIALVDPELTLNLPPAVTAAAGLDAFTQVIEPYVSIRANQMVDMFCREGIKKIYFSIEKAFKDGLDKKAREDMAWGSLLGGLSLANAGLGTVHGFSSVVGGMFGIPHGVVCARLLPLVMDANVKALRARNPESASLKRYHEIAQMISGRENAKIEDGIELVAKLVENLKVPLFREYGMASKDFEQIVKDTLNSNSTKANPIPLTSEELMGIIGKAL